MLPLVVAVGMLFAGGVWVVASAVWPAPRRLRAALDDLNAGGRPRPVFVSAAGYQQSLSLSMGRWLVRRIKATTLADEQTAADLELVGRPLEVYAGSVALTTVCGALLGPIMWATASLAGIRLPIVVPVWGLLFGAIVGWFLPRLLLRAEAAEARVNFRHALGAYLDVLVLLLAAQEGPESAMELAAQAGQGPAFAELRRAVWQARLAGDAVWDTLDELGRRLRIAELREVAAAGSLAGESGAAVRRSLTAKARSLRQAALAEAETTARKRSQALFGPLVLMGLGFVIFLVYPLLTNLSFGT
jgi:Flp pilus assembly protein TadB